MAYIATRADSHAGSTQFQEMHAVAYPHGGAETAHIGLRLLKVNAMQRDRFRVAPLPLHQPGVLMESKEKLYRMPPGF